MPKVSIIVPAYKMEKYLRECLDSVINQTLKDIEIIVVDEGDMDECRNIIDEYEQKDSRIRTIHEKNGGYGASMNKGFKLATGEYLGIVEADDFVDLNMFEDLYNIAKENDAQIVKSDFYEYTTAKNLSRKAGKISKILANKLIDSKEHPEILKIQPTIWTAIYKRDFIIENNLFFLETSGGSFQDASFSFKTLAKANRIVLSDKSYLHYRIDNELSSVKSNGKVFAICDEYHEITNFLNNNPELKQCFNSKKLIKQWNGYIWNLKRINSDYYDEFIKVFKEDFESYLKNGEIDKQFFNKISKKEFNTLLNDAEKFKELITKKVKDFDKRQVRNKNFSVRINSSRIDIMLFGKQILALDL